MNLPANTAPGRTADTGETPTYLIAVSLEIEPAAAAQMVPRDILTCGNHFALELLRRFTQHRLQEEGLLNGLVIHVGSSADGLLVIGTTNPRLALPIILDTLGDAIKLIARIAWFDARELLWRQMFPAPDVFRFGGPIDQARLYKFTGGTATDADPSPENL